MKKYSINIEAIENEVGEVSVTTSLDGPAERLGILLSNAVTELSQDINTISVYNSFTEQQIKTLRKELEVKKNGK